MILKILDLKRGIGIVRYVVHLCKNDTNKSVKIERFAGTNGDFLSHAHYRDPYFDFWSDIAICMFVI